jgi:hypothetical protein
LSSTPDAPDVGATEPLTPEEVIVKSRSHRRSFAVLLASVVLTATSACSSSDDPGDDPLDPNDPGTNGEFFMRANADGAWAAESVFGAIVGLGSFTFSGGKNTGTNPYLISFSMYNIPGPGTYPLGTGSTVAGGSVAMASQVTNPIAAWVTPLSGADGSITITTLSNQRVAGTFNFTVAPLNNTTVSKAVTNGEFVVPFTDLGQNTVIGPLPDNYGSKVTTTFNGTNWNASSAFGTYFAANRVMQFSASNNTRSFNLSLNEVTGPGTYALGQNARVLTLATIGETPAGVWTTSGTGGTGSVTIASVTATRIKGTFSATLQPLQGSGTTGTITVTNGTFDLGLQAPPE